MVGLVLATDPARHDTVLSEFEALTCGRTSGGTSGGGGGSNAAAAAAAAAAETAWARGTDRDHLAAEASMATQLAMLLKAADLGHVTKPLKAHVQWAGRLQQEQASQAELLLKLATATGDRSAAFAVASAATGTGAAARPRAVAAAQVRVLEALSFCCASTVFLSKTVPSTAQVRFLETTAAPLFELLGRGYYGAGHARLPKDRAPPWAAQVRGS
eukprot:SAG22_NODE_2528_length_2474_cov_2.136421_2_plen_215_part_00